MTEIVEINIVNSVAVFFAAIIPLYLSLHLKGHMQKLTLLLSAFAIIHAIYHGVEVFGYEELADDLIEPLSIAVLIVFGFYYLRVKSTRRVET